ncbi:TRAP transporter substrate-binding protein [Azorhizobium sp. AG788]|uniref:TRAP transporter substrate-binding protein n=1 Tax=Azorhizobium sp. AG788 TaxID=2183897 RepID=UPI003139E9C5
MRLFFARAACCSLLALASLSLPFPNTLAAPARAAGTEVVWELANEYPATAIPGQADSFFAAEVARETAGAVVIRPVPDAKSGLRSREQLKAVSEGRIAMADSFGGGLGDDSPVFLLSSLPFVTASPDQARRLYEMARPFYEALFAARGQKLLFITPWPPSGIWSTVPVNSLSALKGLKMRTYDSTGTELFARLCSAASVVSYADLTPKLESGAINAVLSSGDGGAGRQLWKYLPHFSEIVYAVPLSFGTVSLTAWNALDAPMQAAVLKAGAATTAHQWSAMTGRVDANFKRMRENGVTIDVAPPAAVMTAMQDAAAKTLADWRTAAGPEATAILDQFLKETR